MGLQVFIVFAVFSYILFIIDIGFINNIIIGWMSVVIRGKIC